MLVASTSSRCPGHVAVALECGALNEPNEPLGSPMAREGRLFGRAWSWWAEQIRLVDSREGAEMIDDAVERAVVLIDGP